MAVFYYSYAGRQGHRRGTPPPVRRTPAPMSAGVLHDLCKLSPSIAQRAEPIVAQLRAIGFEAPCFLLSENDLAMEPDAHLLFRHASGYALAGVALYWGEPPCYYFLSLLNGGDREERLLTASERLPRAALPAQTRTGPFAWPWPAEDLPALWDLHRRAASQIPRALIQSLPSEPDLVKIYDAFRFDLHRRSIAIRRFRPLSNQTLLVLRKRMEAARAYALRIAATGERHAFLFARLYEQATRANHCRKEALRGLPVLLALAGIFVLLGAAPSLFLWAAGGGVLYGGARVVAERWPRWETRALAGPVALGAVAFSLAESFPLPSLLGTVSVLMLLLPFPRLDGGEIVERLLYRRWPWIKPLLFVGIGGMLAAWAWQQDHLFLVWMGGLIALAPLLDTQRPLLLRRLRRAIDWSAGPTPEAVSSLITTVESRSRHYRKHGVPESLLLQLYRDLQIHTPRLRSTVSGLLIYAVVLTLALLPIAQWFLHSPTLNQIASSAILPPVQAPHSSPLFLPARAEWDTGQQ